MHVWFPFISWHSIEKFAQRIIIPDKSCVVVHLLFSSYLFPSKYVCWFRREQDDNIWNCKLSWIHSSLVCFMNDLACQYNPYSLILHGWLPGTGMSKSSKDLLTPEQSSVGEHLGDPPGWSLIIYQGKKVGHTISLTVMFCINYKWPSNRLPLTWKKDPLNAHNGSSLFQTLDFTLFNGLNTKVMNFNNAVVTYIFWLITTHFGQFE